MRPRIIVDATAEPITYDDIVDHSRLPYDQQRSLIQSYITVARASCENYIDGTISPKTLEIALQTFMPQWAREWVFSSRDSAYLAVQRGYVIELPLGPVQSIVSIKYIDLDGVEQTLDSTKYVLDDYHIPARIGLAYGEVWPVTRMQMDAIKVRYVTGYPFTNSPPTPVPAPILHAIRLQVDHMNDNRTAVDLNNLVALPLGVKYLLDPYRSMSV